MAKRCIFPVPSIIEAALAFAERIVIREIAHSEAAEHDIETVTSTLQSCIDEAQSQNKFIICFVTGVPVLKDSGGPEPSALTAAERKSHSFYEWQWAARKGAATLVYKAGNARRKFGN